MESPFFRYIGHKVKFSPVFPYLQCMSRNKSVINGELRAIAAILAREYENMRIREFILISELTSKLCPYIHSDLFSCARIDIDRKTSVLCFISRKLLCTFVRKVLNFEMFKIARRRIFFGSSHCIIFKWDMNTEYAV